MLLSIAAFAEFALDLMAAGARTELVTRCHQAALEEARHTQACLLIASGLDGDLVPLTTPSRLLAVRRRPRWRAALLARLAAESYFDGWVGEAWFLLRSRRSRVGVLFRCAGHGESRK